MRASSKKTPAAVLRSIIGIKVPEMAELLQCSTATIQSIESGRLKVTDMIAFKMYDQTGVSIQWLQGGDAKRPMTAEGKPYTRAAYERVQNAKALPDREQGSLAGIWSDADRDPVEQSGGTGQDIQVPVRDRVECAGIDAVSHRSVES